MNYVSKIWSLVLLLLVCGQSLWAQEQQAAADTTAVAQVVTDSVADQPAFPKDAPMMERSRTQKLYYIRKINVIGLKHLDPNLVKASAGLVEGDSVYLPSNFISNAITRLWSQRHYGDVRMGAEIDGDSLDLQLFLEERPRVYEWKFEGISTGKQKDIMEKLKLRRNSELSDYVLDKNQKLIKEYWKEK
ncbi:MAG: outer membrane protein assembly factor BamA, partial [Alistipes sp.]|nr:outer membrane protein assembly factor BamA [Alistipes sp.]